MFTLVCDCQFLWAGRKISDNERLASESINSLKQAYSFFTLASRNKAIILEAGFVQVSFGWKDGSCVDKICADDLYTHLEALK